MMPCERPYWEQNLALLQARYPGLAEEIGSTDYAEEDADYADKYLSSSHPCSSVSSVDWHLEQTPTGQPTLAYQETPSSPPILIHSRRDPVKEGLRQAEAVLAEIAASGASSGGANGGVIILLGFGLGYTAEALAKSGCLLVIVERRKELFRLALEHLNLEALLSPGKAVFVIGGNGVGGALALLEKSPVAGGMLAKGKLRIVKNRALVTLTAEDEAWYAEAERQINTWVSKDEINAATLRRFGKRWTRNLADNLAGVLHFPGVNHLENVLAQTGIPVFLAAAGPSLGRVGPHLAEIRQRCVVIAVDTSLRFLLAHGIEPDFVVSVDPQYWNVRHLHRAAAPNAALIAESAVYPSILKPILRSGICEERWQGASPEEANRFQNTVSSESFKRVFFCQSLFPLGRFIEDRTDPKGVLGAGGSVATTAWDFARLLGPEAIWIAGLDLAFPGRQTHFKGALFEENAHAVSGRFCPAETFSVQALESGVPFTSRSAVDGKVLTDRRLSLYAAWFESRFRESNSAAERARPAEQAAGSAGAGLRNYSLSPDGLAIPGLIVAEPEKLLAMPPRRDEIDRRLETVYSRIAENFYGSEKKESRKIRYTSALESLIQGLELIRNNALEAASAAASAFKSSAAADRQSAKTEKILQKFDRINAAIAESPVKDAAGFLFPPAAELERELVETDPLKRHLEFSLRFYRSLAESAGFTLKYLAPSCTDAEMNVL